MNEQEEKQLTLFPEVFRANRLALPGSEAARQMTVISGQKCLELSKNCNRIGLLEKMLLDSSRWASTQRYLIWKARVTPQGRLYFQLVPLVPAIEGNEWPLWPTPTASDTRGLNNYAKTMKKIQKGERGHLGQLPNYLMVLTGKRGRLNPRFYEKLMGFPTGWTELDV